VNEFNRTLYTAPVVRLFRSTDVVVALRVILARTFMVLPALTSIL